MGYGPAAIAGVLLLWIWVASTIVAALFLAPIAVWTFIVLSAATVLFWAIEYVAVAKIPVRPASATSFSRRFLALYLGSYVAIVAAAVVLVLDVGSIRLLGHGMSPTVVDGERLLYSRRVPPGRLSNGQLVVFLHDFPSATGSRQAVIVSRTLAGPGDIIASDGTRYYVNGQPGPLYAPLPAGLATRLSDPRFPGTLTVPPDSYFVVQDNFRNGMDSRQMSWVKRDEVLGTEVMRLSLSRFGQFVR